MTSGATSAYCDFLGIPCPSVADHILRRGIKPLQLFVLALLVHSRPMAMEEVADYLVSLGWRPATGDPRLSLKRAFAGRLPIVQMPNGTFDVELNCIELRMQLFGMGIRVAPNRDVPTRPFGGTASTVDAVGKPKRMLIHGFRVEDELVALTLLDVNQRTLETLYGEAVYSVVGKLKECSVVIGLNPRSLMDKLGIEDVLPWRLIDLARHPRSKQINKRGRKLAITTELLITSSTGIGKPLGDPIKMQHYWREGKRTALTKRLESDAKSLLAFYSYGALHNGIRLRWGFLSESFLAEWGVPGDPSLYDFMKRKMETAEPIEFVRGAAPGWSEPWSRGKIGIVKGIDHQYVALEINDELAEIPREEFQAVRSVPIRKQ